MKEPKLSSFQWYCIGLLDFEGGDTLPPKTADVLIRHSLIRRDKDLPHQYTLTRKGRDYWKRQPSTNSTYHRGKDGLWVMDALTK